MRVRQVLFGSAAVCAVLLLAVSTAWACSPMLSFPARASGAAPDPEVQPGATLTLSLSGATSDVEIHWDRETGPLLAAYVNQTAAGGGLSVTVTVPVDAPAGTHLLQAVGFAMVPVTDSAGRVVSNPDGSAMATRQAVGHAVASYTVKGSPVVSHPLANANGNRGVAVGGAAIAPAVPATAVTVPAQKVGTGTGTGAGTGGAPAAVPGSSVSVTGSAQGQAGTASPASTPATAAAIPGPASAASAASADGAPTVVPAASSAVAVPQTPLAFTASGDLWSGFTAAGRPGASQGLGLVGGSSTGGGGSSTMRLGIAVLMLGLVSSLGGVLVVRSRRRVALSSPTAR